MTGNDWRNAVQWHGRGEIRGGRGPELPVLPKRVWVVNGTEEERRLRLLVGSSEEGEMRGGRRRRLTSVQRMQLVRAGVIGLCLGAFVGWGLGTLWDAFVPETVPSHWDFPRVTPGERLEFAPRSPRPWGAEL
jgi:hypothetical protein